MDIGAKIKEIRKSKGLTQEDLAQRSGVAQSAISYIERQGKQPNIDTIMRIANTLGISIADILGEPASVQPHFYLPIDLETFLAQDPVYFNGTLLDATDKMDILTILHLLWGHRKSYNEEKAEAVPIDPPRPKREKIRQLAEKLVQTHQTREPQIIMEAMGMEIIRKETGEGPCPPAHNAGLSITIQNGIESAYEKYMLAHQLGHILLHHSINSMPAHYNESLSAAYNKDADLFAAYLLVDRLPEENEDIVAFSRKENIPAFLIGILCS